jgi:hypothetical protein
MALKKLHSAEPRRFSAGQKPAVTSGLICPHTVLIKENIAILSAFFLFNLIKLSIHVLGANVNHPLLFVADNRKRHDQIS